MYAIGDLPIKNNEKKEQKKLWASTLNIGWTLEDLWKEDKRSTDIYHITILGFAIVFSLNGIFSTPSASLKIKRLQKECTSNYSDSK